MLFRETLAILFCYKLYRNCKSKIDVLKKSSHLCPRMKGRQVLGLFLQIGLIMGCSEEEPILQNPNPNPPPSAPAVCVVDEMEFRNGDDVITGIREFNYNINQGNRLESITIVEGFDQVPQTVSFELKYGDGDAKGILNQMNEVFDGDVVTNTLFKYNSDGKRR